MHDKIPLLIRDDLNGDKMIQMMANENMQSFGHDVYITQETIRAVVKAYAEGKIDLPEPKTATGLNVGSVRYAPGFVRKELRPDPPAMKVITEKPYTMLSIGRYLGWVVPSGNVQHRVQIALQSLELVELGVLDESRLKGLRAKEAKNLVQISQRKYDQAIAGEKSTN
jgi:hypothetical protein